MATPTTTPYDETPYPSGPYQQTHPDRLATLAKFFGMTPPDIRCCRVLELGAADGSNLIPIACAYPESRFVGVDLSRRHVDAGLETIASMGLSNIKLLHLDIRSVDASFGVFDYVIAHGIYSWVPAEVQDRILEICSEGLATNGVAYVSYNTNPGWRMRGLLRDMMLYHSRKFDDPKTRIAQARALVQWLAETVDSDADPYGMLLKRELDQMRHWQDAYFRHDSLGEINEPLYFHEFMQRAEGHGLQYLAEAEFTPMLASNYSPPVDETLNRMGRDIIELEQYMDFLRNRLFRQTLLCHDDVNLNRALGPWSLRDFHIAASLRAVGADQTDDADRAATFRGPRDLVISSSQPIVKAALTLLAESWPESIPFSELATKARAFVEAKGVVCANDGMETELGGALLTCYTKGLCELHAHPGAFVANAGDRPCACPLARWQASRGAAVTNRRHERIFLDSLAQHLLPLLDGERDHDALLDALAALVAGGALVLEKGDASITDADQARTALAPELAARIIHFGRQALLVR